MTAENFAKEFYKQKKSSLDLYFNHEQQTHVGDLIKSLKLDEQGSEKIRQIIDGVLVDAFYTILLRIDGAAQIGENQELYKLIDEDGNE